MTMIPSLWRGPRTCQYHRGMTWEQRTRDRYNAYQRAYRQANREDINRKRRLMRKYGHSA